MQEKGRNPEMNLRNLRLLIVAVLLGLTGWTIGAGFPVAAVASGAVLLMLLPGLFDSFVPPPAEESAAEPVPDPVLQPGLMIEDIHDAALMLSADGAVIAANRAATELLGGTMGEHVRLALRQPAALDLVETALSDGRELMREVEGLGRTGAVYNLRARPTSGGDLLVTISDMSPARAAERTRTDFVANASHELRTPLASLTGFIETLQGPAANDDEARSRFLGVMADEAARMTRLIDDLLSLSRVERDKNVRPRDAVDVADLLNEYVATMQQWHGDLVIEAREDLPAVMGDHDQLLQVLGNLVTNAIKYGRENTPVIIRANMAAGMVRISIINQGDGIAAEHIPRLTERFYRVDAGRSRQLGGTGLGLAIVKHIVERHRGRLEIRSKQGEGTVVSFTLMPVQTLSGPSVTKVQTDNAR